MRYSHRESLAYRSNSRKSKKRGFICSHPRFTRVSSDVPDYFECEVCGLQEDEQINSERSVN